MIKAVFFAMVMGLADIINACFVENRLLCLRRN